jgi:hypothetical protein
MVPICRTHERSNFDGVLLRNERDLLLICNIHFAILELVSLSLVFPFCETCSIEL